MLTIADRVARYQKLQAVFRNRSHNLRKLVNAMGADPWHTASRRTGKSIQLLKQVCGDNPCRSIGDTLAHELETLLRLHPGELDRD